MSKLVEIPDTKRGILNVLNLSNSLKYLNGRFYILKNDNRTYLLPKNCTIWVFKGSGILKYNNKYIQKLNNQIFLTEKYGYTLELKKESLIFLFYNEN